VSDTNITALREEKKVLLFTSLAEFAERYGYYVIQSLLIFYLIEKFGIYQDSAASLVGTTLSMVYISAILGGFVAERYIGYYRSGFLGSIFMLAGFSVLALSSSENMLCLGLSFISVSTGLIKSNMASFIGRFYDQSGLPDSKRDFGFNIFYMGINLGSFSALFIASWLKNKYGFSAPFYSSMVVSVFMLSLLLVGFGVLNKHIADTKFTLVNAMKITLILTVYMVVLFFIFKKPTLADLSIVVALVGSIVILYLSIKKSSVKKVIVAGIFFALSIIYWGLYFQMFISLLLFTEYSVDTSVLSPSQFLSVQALSILLFASIMGKFWVYIDNKGFGIRDIDKFNIGFVLIAVTFCIILVPILLSSPLAKVSMYGFIFAYIVLAISELSLSAIGLSLITKIAPKGFVALYMGIWLITLGIGGKLGGLMASYITLPKGNLDVAKTHMSQGLYAFIAIAICTSLFIVFIRRYVNRNTH
jgi:POT family proton-dependent oligopeptide transporter